MSLAFLTMALLAGVSRVRETLSIHKHLCLQDAVWQQTVDRRSFQQRLTVLGATCSLSNAPRTQSHQNNWEEPVLRPSPIRKRRKGAVGSNVSLSCTDVKSWSPFT